MSDITEYKKHFDNFLKDFEDTGSRLLTDISHDPFGTLTSMPSRAIATMSYPKCNHTITKTQHRYNFHVPGLEPKNLELKIKNKNSSSPQMIIRGERKHNIEEDSEHGYYREVSYGKFSRTLSIPNDAMIDSVTSKYENGIMSVIFNRKETSEEFDTMDVPIN